MLYQKRYGKGFGFRGSSPAWPYAGRGKGGLPRCLAYGLQENPEVIGRPTKSPVTEVDFLKSQAQALKQRLEVVESRIRDLEKKKEGVEL